MNQWQNTQEQEQEEEEQEKEKFIPNFILCVSNKDNDKSLI